MIAIGKVVNIDDIKDGERIKVRLEIPEDKCEYDDNKLPYAFPLMPKMIHIKPKVGEAVFVVFDDTDRKAQRYYIGPIIAQPQNMYKDLYGGGATNLLSGGLMESISNVKKRPITKYGETPYGAFPNDEDIAILGRKDCDIILSDDDVRIRCGVHELSDEIVRFNSENPSFIKLKYYPDTLNYVDEKNKQQKINSSTTIVGEKINLISTKGDPYFEINDREESISDETMKKIITKAHQLPYGDVLCEFLSDFLTVFKNHTHNYTNLPIVEDPTWQKFSTKYGTTKDSLENKILSENIRIN